MDLQFNFTGFEQHLIFNHKPFHARIYEGSSADIPEGFNVMRIALDASECSLLNWKEAIYRAQMAIKNGLLILWELEFDLLKGSLEEETRFLTLQLNIQHFNDIIWASFRSHTFGVALFRAELSETSLDYSEREVVINYLKSLAALLPDEISCFLFLDAHGLSDATAYFQAINPEIFGHFHLILKGGFAKKYPWSFAALGWGHGHSCFGYCSDTIYLPQPIARLKYGLCLPKKANPEHVQQVLEMLSEIPFRLIYENLLTYEWDGIDSLIIFPNQLSEQSLRKLKGFIAAGGEVIKFPDDATSLLPQEISHPFYPAFLQ